MTNKYNNVVDKQCSEGCLVYVHPIVFVDKRLIYGVNKQVYKHIHERSETSGVVVINGVVNVRNLRMTSL